MVTSLEGSAGGADALSDETFRRELRRRSGRFARRYYPFAIGGAFLAVVVGVLPSTLPSNSLGFLPTLPPRHLSVASPVASTPTTVPGVPVSTTPEPPFFAEGVGSGALPASSIPVAAGAATTPAPTASSGSTPPASNGESCDLPLPKEPPAPPAADLLEAFAVAGPFGADAVAGAGFLAPVLPVVTPLLPLAGALTGKNGAVLSQLLVTIGNEENSLLAPVVPYISAGNQATLSTDQKLLTELGPVLHLAEGLPDLDCVGVLEIEAGSTIDPSGYPGATSLLGSVSSTEADNHVVAFSADWAHGVSPSLQKAIDGLVAAGVPVELHLVDSVPSGHLQDTTGFATWVTSVMSQNPKIAIFEVDPSPAPRTASADPGSSLADALDAAVTARSVGQLVGMGLPVPLASAPWWSEVAPNCSRTSSSTSTSSGSTHHNSVPVPRRTRCAGCSTSSDRAC